MRLPILRVALALVHQQAVWLVARRPDDAHLGGLWEFPGGKIERNESAREAALRELREECAVGADVELEGEPLTWQYADRTVELHPVFCRWRRGRLTPSDGHLRRWVTVTELEQLDMPPANREIIAQLRRFQAVR